MSLLTKRRIGLGGAALLVAAIAFGATYMLRGPEELADAEAPPPTFPARDVTPEPGSTPSTEAPFWHVPYINEDASKPLFSGDISGIRIDPNAPGGTGYDACPGTGLMPPEPRAELKTATAPGPLSIDPSRLPAGITPADLPDGWLCKGELNQLNWAFSVAAGTANANEGGSSLLIHRRRGLEPIRHAAPEERWGAARINGHDAVVSSPVVAIGSKQFGACFAAVYDKESDVLTTVLASAAMSEFCIEVAEAIVR